MVAIYYFAELSPESMPSLLEACHNHPRNIIWVHWGSGVAMMSDFHPGPGIKERYLGRYIY
jgi:hypothetical protein